MPGQNYMSLFRITIGRIYKDQLLNELSQIHDVHIKERLDQLEREEKQTKEDQSSLDRIKKLRQISDTLLKKLNIKQSDFDQLKVEQKETFTGKNLDDLINHTLEEVNFYSNRINELERYIAKARIELENVKINEKCYSFLKNYNLNRFSLSYFSQLNFRVYTTFTKNIENLVNLFDFEAFPNVYQWEQTSEDRIIIFIVYPKDKENELNERIKLIHAEEIHIYKKYLMYDKINFERIYKEIDYIERTLTKYELEVQRIRNENLLKFAAIEEVIKNIEDYFWVQRQFEAVSPTTFVLKFFIPARDKTQVKDRLLKAFKDKIIVDAVNIEKGEKITEAEIIKKEGKDGKVPQFRKKEEEEDLRKETPTIMKHNFLIRPFETLVKMYGVPAYGETDPTPFIAISFPFLFGLMFGDIGHGLCLVIAGLMGGILFRKKSENLRNFSWIIFYCGWGAILAGILYGEFFGQNHIFGYQLVPVHIGSLTLYNPLNNITMVLKFALLVGVVQINFGWSIQFLNYWRQKRRYLAFTDSLTKIFLLTGGTILLFVWGFNLNAWFAEPFPILLPIIPGILLIFFKPLGKALKVSYLNIESYSSLFGEGSFETFETFLSVLSNVASYIRLLALALAHIALMFTIEAIIGLFTATGILTQIFKVIGLILGNVMVILLEGLLAFINALRLHFYEFFFKFYQGTGTEFYPFYLESDFSNIVITTDYEVDVISEEIEKEITIKKAQENIERAREYIINKYL